MSEYLVVRNEEGQYSVWAADRPAPAGWYPDGTSGTHQECLDHIERVWTDRYPRTLPAPE